MGIIKNHETTATAAPNILFVFIFPAKEYAIPITAKIAIISKVAPAGFEIKRC